MKPLFVDNDDINLILNFIPKGEVPKGLDPTFYHTATYDGDIKLQATADKLREQIMRLKING